MSKPVPKRRLPIYNEWPAATLHHAINLIACELRAVPDDHGGFSVGYNHRLGVGPGAEVSHNRALDLLRADIDHARELLLNTLHAPLFQWEHDAMCLLLLTIEQRQWFACGAFKRLMANDHDNVVAEIAGQPDRWGEHSIAIQPLRRATIALWKNEKAD